jgi:hypothetical protein
LNGVNICEMIRRRSGTLKGKPICCPVPLHTFSENGISHSINGVRCDQTRISSRHSVRLRDLWTFWWHDSSRKARHTAQMMNSLHFPESSTFCQWHWLCHSADVQLLSILVACVGDWGESQWFDSAEGNSASAPRASRFGFFIVLRSKRVREFKLQSSLLTEA